MFTLKRNKATVLPRTRYVSKASTSGGYFSASWQIFTDRRYSVSRVRRAQLLSRAAAPLSWRFYAHRTVRVLRQCSFRRLSWANMFAG